MKLGIISNYLNQDLKKVNDLGLGYVEFCINRNEGDFFSVLSSTKKSLNEYELHVSSIGRWGTDKINEQGLIQKELEVNFKLIDACVYLGSPVFVTGVNYIDHLSEHENMELAISYLKEVITYAKAKGIKTAVFNCRWNNFIVGPDQWDILIERLADLYIKYDPSHAIYDDKDYLKEISHYGNRIIHFHLKGSLRIDQLRVDDPPAGLDMTNWQAVMALLYYHQYQGVLSVEPHSATWSDDLGEFGIKYTVNYFKPMIYGGKK